MENITTEALVFAVASLIASIAGWIKVTSDSKARENLAKERDEKTKQEFQQALIESNTAFRGEIEQLKTKLDKQETRHTEEKEQWQASNKKLSDELTAQLEGQTRERAEMREQIGEYQALAKKQGDKLELQDNDIKELQTQVTGFKALADELSKDRNRLKAELEKAISERDAALQSSAEKDGIIVTLKAERDALVQDFDTRIKNLEAAIQLRDEQIANLTEQVAKLSLEKALEDVPTEPKPTNVLLEFAPGTDGTWKPINPPQENQPSTEPPQDAA